MFLKGAQQGGARRLAAHLLKTKENEHVEVHELSGLITNDFPGALNEIYAVPRGTKCPQLMFSVTLNTAETEEVATEYFEKAIADIERKTELTDRPAAIAFHEKEGRRYCYAVESHIDTNAIKAINLTYKMKLQDVSKNAIFSMAGR